MAKVFGRTATLVKKQLRTTNSGIEEIPVGIAVGRFEVVETSLGLEVYFDIDEGGSKHITTYNLEDMSYTTARRMACEDLNGACDMGVDFEWGQFKNLKDFDDFRREQERGWDIVKITQPLPNGSVIYQRRNGEISRASHDISKFHPGAEIGGFAITHENIKPGGPTYKKLIKLHSNMQPGAEFKWGPSNRQGRVNVIMTFGDVA